jgi:hypothetical protein
MQYKNEKEIIIDQLEGLINRGLNTSVFPQNAQVEGTQLFTSDMKLLSNDPEITRLFIARQVLIGTNNIKNTINVPNSTSTEIVPNSNLVDEFKKAYDFLCGLRNEKDHGKAILGLIEFGIFILQIVTALSANEASRNRH